MPRVHLGRQGMLAAEPDIFYDAMIAIPLRAYLRI